MTELNQDPFDARWLNCLYGGKLAGRAKIVTDAIVLIEPLLVITLSDGTKVKKFFGLRKNCSSDKLIKDDYVIFDWRNVGERSYDRKREEEGDPEAIEIEVVTKNIAEEVATQLRRLHPNKLREQWDIHLSLIEEKKANINAHAEEIALVRTEEKLNELKEYKKQLIREEEFLKQKEKELEMREIAIPEEVAKLVKSRTAEFTKQVQEKLSELNRERESVKKQQESLNLQRHNLNQEVEELATTRTREIQEQFEAKQKQLTREIQSLADRTKQFLVRQEQLKLQEAQLLEIRQQIEPYRLAVPVEILPNRVIEPVQLPSKLGTKWHQQLQKEGLQVSRNIANSFLLSMLSGFYSGGIVLLNGSVGVGKTSIVKHSAKLIGGSCAIIPVRPAWIEPADLLGFFDPIHEIFRPTSFLTALKNAETDRERLNLICLDELNLAKIENYASDLLSKLEYSREFRESNELDEAKDDNSILLFSDDIERELWQEIDYLEKQKQLESKQKARQQRLKMFLQKWRSHQPVPQNMILLGTLNSDETTYDLSPKVIDRSYTITYPIADFNQLPKQVTNQAATQINSISSSKLRQVLHDGYKKNWDLVINGKSQDWVKIQQWQKDYFAEASALGIPLGYRTMKDYAVFCAIADWLELNPKEAFSHFLFTKILPRISFFKDNQTNSLFQEWLKELKQNYKTYDPANILDRLERQLNDERRQIVRYWG
ncbi:MAG: AAA family ATPase [Pseudanabaena sp. M57BS1SP1A06MG]|nr:AAA family ATPase [Pseudanabaena sp. M53BS1SP1A06MG]MCA6581115.1 AAA family ATPase [Pseudanabaena sp. M34BS1SP1A06MG]MCA6592797.1 AAA family ATPase [Pseudanabaena sp. M38BS1SP1A06MG]MCA6601329.1 AAA family ATPase [Pseudanabaena sp. M57BS1SP1A06MG]